MLDNVVNPTPNPQYIPVLCEWEILEEEVPSQFQGSLEILKGLKLVSKHKLENIMVNTGRDTLFEFLLAMTGATPSAMVYMGVGASSVADDGTTTNPLVTDTHLYYELIGEQRKGITNTNGIALSTSDINLQTITVGGCTFYKYVVVQAIWPSGSLNNGNFFRSYALFSTPSVPLTNGGTAGVMFNELFDPAPINKQPTNQITAQMTLRF